MGQKIAIMDASGIDLAVLSSGAGLEGHLEKCHAVNAACPTPCHHSFP